MEQEIQGKIIEFSMFEQENQKIEQQLQMIEQQFMNLHALRANLDEIEIHKGEFLASLGSGVFLRSELKDNKRVLINVGSGIVVEKSCDDARKILERQVTKLEQVRKEVEDIAGKNFEMMIKLETEIRSIVGKAQGLKEGLKGLQGLKEDKEED